MHRTDPFSISLLFPTYTTLFVFVLHICVFSFIISINVFGAFRLVTSTGAHFFTIKMPLCAAAFAY